MKTSYETCKFLEWICKRHLAWALLCFVSTLKQRNEDTNNIFRKSLRLFLHPKCMTLFVPIQWIRICIRLFANLAVISHAFVDRFDMSTQIFFQRKAFRTLVTFVILKSFMNSSHMSPQILFLRKHFGTFSAREKSTFAGVLLFQLIHANWFGLEDRMGRFSFEFFAIFGPSFWFFAMFGSHMKYKTIWSRINHRA